MARADDLPLLEKIRSRISIWMVRFLSYAGRLQLINSVLTSITKFWLSVFCLPRTCIEEIEKLVSAFLWSGSVLNPRKANVRWEDICLPRKEGGLGIKNIREANQVSTLKLTWRILTAQNSLWVNWVKAYLIRQGSYWTLSSPSVMGSWMWMRILKCRELAKGFHRVEINDGMNTSFWHDWWSPMSRLIESVGERGLIEFGIGFHCTVADVVHDHRRRRHRVVLYDDIENLNEGVRETSRPTTHDKHLWHIGEGNFKPFFSTSAILKVIRQPRQELNWSKGIWFQNHTAKYSSMTWLALKDRLSTGDKMKAWNINTNARCIFCNNQEEMRSHLFSECVFTTGIWTKLARRLLHRDFTSTWEEIIALLSNKRGNKLCTFMLRYLFQISVYTIWRERNSRRHGEQPQGESIIVKEIDKGMRNRLYLMRYNKRYENRVQKWFSMSPLHLIGV